MDLLQMMNRNLSDDALACLVKRVLQAVVATDNDAIPTLAKDLPRVITVNDHELGLYSGMLS